MGRMEKGKGGGWGSGLEKWERWEDSEVTRSEKRERSEVASWERWEGNEMARWKRWESSDVAMWEVPGFINRWGTQGESNIASFCF